MATFKAIGYDLQRKSENKLFTHAVIFRNNRNEIGADFHTSILLAEKNVKAHSKRFWIEVIEIVLVEKVGA